MTMGEAATSRATAAGAPERGKSGSRLERVLAAGHFAVTAEIGPPMGNDAEVVRTKAAILRGTADAFNVTDCQTAIVRMSSLAAAVILLGEGLEPVMQMTCRDRNRIAMQADILGASALGIRNCLCIAGDHQSKSASGKLKGHPGAKNVYDLDSIQLLSVLRGMRDEAVQQGGDKLAGRVPLFLGAAWTPMGRPVEFRTVRLAKKIAAGADFIQTQAVYDVEAFETAMKRVRDLGLPERAAILPGVIVPRSAGMLRYMRENVPGIEVPDALIARMAGATDAKAEGIRVAIELVQKLREVQGVRGVHLQAIEWEAAIPEVAKGAGLSPRPEV